MKLKSILKVIFALFAVVSISSCDDFLTQDNPNGTASSEYFTTVDRCEAAMTGVYNAFKNQNIYAISSDNLRSDIACEGGNGTNRETFDDVAYLHSYTDTYGTISSKWAALYTGIRRCNDLLDGIEIVRETIFSESQLERLDEMQAQTLFMRGLFYFYISVTFRHKMEDMTDACAPLITESIDDVENLSQPLVAGSVIREQCRQDWLNSIDLGLPDEWTDVEDTGRVTRWSAYAMLGISYLYQATDCENKYLPETEDALGSEECYAEARAYFKKIIDSGYFELAEFGHLDPTKAHNFTTEGEFNCESILEVSYTLTDNTNLSGEALLYNTYSRTFATKGGYYTCIPSLWLVNEVMCEAPDEKNDVNWVEIDLTLDEFYNTPNEDGDIIKDVLYTQMGIGRINEPYSKSNDPGYMVSDAIVHKYTGDNKVTGEAEYDSNIYKRTIVYRNDVAAGGSGRVISTTYTSLFPYGSRRVVRDAAQTIVEDESYLKVKYVDGKLYRLRKFTERASYTMALNGDDDLGYYGDSTPQQQACFSNGTTAVFRKHTNWDTRTSESEATITTSSGINYRLIRLADIYLMYAEALIEGGSKESGVNEALMYVNRVRRRAGAKLLGSYTQSSEYSRDEATFDGDVEVVQPTDDYTGCAGPYYQSVQGEMKPDDLMKHLMWVERPIELCLEGYMMRVCDLRRWVDPDTKTYNVTSDRFKELATSLDYTYYFDNPKYLSVNATTGAFGTSTNYQFQERYSSVEQGNMDDGETLYRDYQAASSGYDTPGDWYFPIPNSEKITNPYIN